MISTLFHAIFYNPIYNALVALISLIPGGDVGIAVILLTILIRVVLLPFTLSAARSQRALRALEPKLKALKELHKGDKEKEAVATLELYRTERVNPFSSILTLLVQLPVLLALFWVFRHEPFTTIDAARIYGFTPLPDNPSPMFLGFIDVAGKSLVLALLAGAAQYLQALFALAGNQPTPSGMNKEFAQMMNTMVKYVFPVLIATVAYTTSAAIALYFLTSNLAGALQEWWVKRGVASAAV